MDVTLISMTHCWQMPFSWHIITWNSVCKSGNLIFLQKSSNILYSPQRLLVRCSCCYSNLCLLPQTAPLVHQTVKQLFVFFVSVPLQARAKFYTWHRSDLSFCLCYFMKRFVISFSLPHYTNPLSSCPPAAPSSVQSPQGFVAIIIIFSQHAPRPLEGWFDRSSPVICLKADFSSSLQHHACVPPPPQVLSVELVLPGQCVCSLWPFLLGRVEWTQGVQGWGPRMLVW